MNRECCVILFVMMGVVMVMTWMMMQLLVTMDQGPRIIDLDWSAIIHSNGLIGER